MKYLSDLKNGETGFISTISGGDSFRLRLEELGFVPGQEVTRTYASPLGSPIVFAMLGQKVALRRGEAQQIAIEATAAEALEHGRKVVNAMGSGSWTYGGEQSRALSCDSQHCHGCTGCGQATKPQDAPTEGELTVALVGNPNCGKTAFFNAASGGHERTGNYAGVTVSSVVGRTTFEDTALRVVDLPGTYSLRAFTPEEAFVANELAKGEIDVIINVLDVNNLERNLLLTLQLQKTGVPIVGVLNMYDEFEQSHSELDIQLLESRLGIPLIPAVASKGKGVAETLRQAINVAKGRIQQDAVSAESEEKTVAPMSMHSLATNSIHKKSQQDTDPHARVHAFLDGIYLIREGRAQRFTAWVDRFLVKAPIAYLLFFMVMGMIFYLTFQVGAYPMSWMEDGVAWLSAQISGMMAEGPWRALLVDGIMGGVGSVIVFLPNILILYFFISILEDSGYFARTALLADPLFRRFGLHGKSFIPMLMGFGCSVPAVMATRTIDSRKNRLITMMTLPFMSCSARLPVYTILAGAFFPDYAAWVMLALYAGGILMALGAAWVLNLVFHRNEEGYFVMEMPPYRLPVARGILKHTWEKGRQYLQKMGGIILIASIVVWALGYFPQSDKDLTPAQQQEQSYLGQVGRAITPVLEPLGYDWHLGVGIIAGVGAKELMVSSIGVLYNVPVDEGGEAEKHSLAEGLKRSGTTPAAALSYLVFALLYFPCLATLAAIKGESGHWKYALFTAGYTTAIAYAMAFIVYRIALLFL